MAEIIATLRNRLLVSKKAGLKLIESLRFVCVKWRLNNPADQISALATAIHQSYLLTLLEQYLLCRETPLMRPFKFELILGAKSKPSRGH